MNGVVGLATTIAVIAGGFTGAVYLVSRAWRGLRKVGHLVDQLVGEPATGSQPAQLGLLARLARIEAEVTHNGGGSLKDAVARIETRVNEHVTLPHIDPTQHLLGRDR